MLNLKNNENDAVFDEIWKKKNIFGQHTLFEKSPSAIDV